LSYGGRSRTLYFGPLYNQIRHCCSAVIKMAFHGLRNRAPFSLSHLRPNKVSRLPHTTSHNMYVHLNMFENCCNHLLVARVGNDPTYCALRAHANPSQLPSHGPGFLTRTRKTCRIICGIGQYVSGCEVVPFGYWRFHGKSNPSLLIDSQA